MIKVYLNLSMLSLITEPPKYIPMSAVPREGDTLNIEGVIYHVDKICWRYSAIDAAYMSYLRLS